MYENYNNSMMIMLTKGFAILVCFHLLETALANGSPCKVFYARDGNIARCQEIFFNIENLKESLGNITETVHTLELYNVSLDALSVDIFEELPNKPVRKIILIHSSLEHLQIPEINNSSPFQSLKDTLESFEVYDSSSVFGWNFSAFSSLNKLKTLIIEDSEVIQISNEFSNVPNLQFIQVLNASVRWIHPRAFEFNENLTICSLANNIISNMKRSMFPKPALHLWSLDLSYNKLEDLPKNLFTEMPSLRELKLDNNQLTRVGASIITPVWMNLTQLWLDGNQEICYPFCKIIKEKAPPLFMDSSKCRIPHKSKKYIIFDSLLSEYC